MEIIHVLLADDDVDDCLLFRDALNELSKTTVLSTVSDGEQLMRVLDESPRLPDVLFLDLNMPRKNGLECLVQIKSNVKTESIPVVIFSTSFNPDVVSLLHTNGARFYIRKPDEFEDLKTVIARALLLFKDQKQVVLSQFVLQP
jgi:CheY-like chemotaxis protein